MRCCLLLVCWSFLAIRPAIADAGRVDFSRDIRPILAQHCWACHGADEKARESGLRLDDRNSALAKKAIVPKDAKASRLISRIESNDPDRQMPPPEAKKPLSDRQKQQLRAWIDQGGEYSQHWAFVAPKRPAVPNLAEGVRNPIDTFVRERLAREKFAASAEADRATLLRRVSLDLTGKPPSLEEIDSFLADRSPDAYEKVVDRLLASPRYAERMAMVWLDAARFADTNGFNNDEDRTQWPWRDWLIDAFARNLTYDRFLIEQLAGDLLPAATLNQRVATAFLRNQVHNTEGGIIPEEYRIEYVADRVHTTATVFLGLSMQCARCHDHKYDPITQREYYQFFGFFQNIADRQASYSNFIGAEPYIRVPSAEQRERLAKLDVAQRDLEKQIHEREKNADAAIRAWEQSLTDADRERLRSAGLLLGIALDESSGTTVSTTDGTVKGTVRGNAKWSAGKVGNAIELDGQSFVEIAGGPKFDGDAFSVSAWVYPTANDLLAIASRMDDGAAHRGWDMLLENGKVSTHLVHHWPDNGLKVVTKKAIATNAWHHILMTYDGHRKGAGVRIYVDGKLEPTDITNDKLRDTIRTDKPFHIGRRGASLPFKGRIDDLRIYGLELTGANAGQLASGKSPDLVSSPLGIAGDKRTPDQQAAVRLFYLDHVDRDYARLKTSLAETAQQRTQIEKSMPVLMVMEEQATPRDLFVLKRGQYDRPGEKVSVGVPNVFPPLGHTAKTPTRLDLAKWLVSDAHPLTARVAVNRWWEMYFGVGLVKTVEDFGTTGEYPTHPELLDWLATELIRTGWDIKAMQRLIVTSATYRQSSAISKVNLERDPENRLLARGPRHRLSAEAVRDNALAISGLLVERLGGPSVKPYQPAGLWEDVTVERRGKYVPDQGESLYRRSMYTFWKRTCPPPGLMMFDAPNREVCVARRSTTNTPLQALVLLNDPTYIEAARKLAEQMLRGGTSPETRLQFGFRRATSRLPSELESRLLLKTYAEARARFQSDPAAAKELLKVGNSPVDQEWHPSDLAAWTVVASTIFNLDETITKR